ncbi:MAG: hypothetical protein JO325_17975 [Solirubrobacterales bacterium]|nr:hypothetical protein [Solirubrobacterales bacterium]
MTAFVPVLDNVGQTGSAHGVAWVVDRAAGTQPGSPAKPAPSGVTL